MTRAKVHNWTLKLGPYSGVYRTTVCVFGDAGDYCVTLPGPATRKKALETAWQRVVIDCRHSDRFIQEFKDLLRKGKSCVP